VSDPKGLAVFNHSVRILVLLSILCWLNSAVAEIELASIQVGFDQIYKHDRWTAVQATIESRYESFEGQLELRVQDTIADQANQTYIQPVVLQQVDRQQRTFLIWMPNRSVELRFQLRSHLGDVRLIHQLTPAIPKPLADLVVLVVSPTISYRYDQTEQNWSVQKETDPGSGVKSSGSQVFVAHTTPSQLPKVWLGYDSVDLMILHDVRLTERYFPSSKQMAILDWICRGGTLILEANDHYLGITNQQTNFLTPWLPVASLPRPSPTQTEQISLHPLGNGQLGILPTYLQQMVSEDTIAFWSTLFNQVSMSARHAEARYDPYRRHRERIYQQLKTLKPQHSPLIRHLFIFSLIYVVAMWLVSRQQLQRYIFLSLVVPIGFILVLILPSQPERINLHHFSMATVYGRRQRLHLKSYLGIIGQKQVQASLQFPASSAIRTTNFDAAVVQTPTAISMPSTIDPWQVQILEVETFLDLNRHSFSALKQRIGAEWQISGETPPNTGATHTAPTSDQSYGRFQAQFSRSMEGQRKKYADIMIRENLLRHLFKEQNQKTVSWTTLPDKLVPLMLPDKVSVNTTSDNSLIIVYPKTGLDQEK